MRTFLSTVLLLLLMSGTCCLAGQLSRQEHALLTRAYTLIEKEQYRKSLNLLGSLLKKKKPSSYTFAYAALCYGNLDQTRKAIAILRRAVLIYPKNSGFLHNLGVYQMQNENFEGAVTSFRKVLKLKSDNHGTIRYNLAFALYRLKRFKEGIGVIDGAPQKERSKKQWQLLKLYCQVELKRWKSAEQTGLGLVTRFPDAVNVWNLLGQINVNRHNYARGAAYLEISKAVSGDRTNSRSLLQLYSAKAAWNELARYRLERGAEEYRLIRELIRSCQYQKALDQLFASTLRRDKEYGLVRGRLLYLLGRNKESIEQLLEVERLDFSLNNKKDSVEGKRRLRQERDRLQGEAYLLAGQILWLEDRWEEARDIFKKLELLPGKSALGKSFANCMQSLLSEQQKEVIMPAIDDPPLLFESNKG